MWLTQVAKAKERYRHRLVYVRASRQTTSVVPLAAERLMALSPEELHFPLSIRFAGEPGVDAGGLEREWYNTVATALFDPAMGYFVQVEHTSKSMLIHPHASPKWFRGIGRFLGRALFDGHPIPARMNGVLYKQLLGVPYSVDDIQFIDASVYRSLKWMLSQQSPDDCVCTLEALELDFTVMEQTLDERGRPTGTSRVVDLKPYGRQCRVTNANVAEYVELYVHWLCLTRVSACVAALRRGLQDVLPPSMLLLDMMDHKELELLLCGTTCFLFTFSRASWMHECAAVVATPLPHDDESTKHLARLREDNNGAAVPRVKDGAALLLRWQPCVGAKTYHLQQSRDWPVKVWKQCSTTPIQPSVRQTDHPAVDAEVPTDMALLECVVYGLDFSRSYVFRVRCALESGACGDFSDASDAITTSPKAPNPVKMSGACVPTPPADVALVYHSDFEGDSNAMSLVVTWTAVPHATTYQVQWMRHGQRLVWRNSPELSAWEVAVDQPSPERVENETAAAAAAPTMQYMLQGTATSSGS
ncbi:hypothetical protein DYB32_005828 [Aphanomyces invadans]|uniref:HECT-type E3 ubiquitin transferase n=1 Tax=Aphanomyces invadans TaxID=157072 RepID=A0A3R6Y7B2_9STRA|nr:hypothetical protein DYB32_005828 [Aphanomyces invadans]